MRRRTWLQGTTALGAIAVSGVGLGAGCGDPGAATALVLEVEPTRAIVAAWSAYAASATVRLTTAAGASAGGWELRFSDDGTGWVDATGLQPATGYRARITTSDGGELGELTFTTAPRDDDPRPLRIAVSADVDESPDYDSPIFEAAADERPDLFVSLGDWPYADNGPAPAVTRGEYHAKYLVNRLAPRQDRWQRSTSFRAIFDDHEFANDWDGAARAADPARHAAALAAWDAWFPRRDAGPRYRRWRWGALADCFVLDCRGFRSANAAPDDDDKTMLGAEQRAWLVAGLAASTATYCLIFTSVPLDFGHGDDHWAAYRTERDAIFDALRALARPVLFIAGDQHWFAAHRHRYRLRELQVGPLSRGLIPPPDFSAPGVIARSSQYNFGVIEIDAAARLTFRAVGAYGATFYTESFTPADLTPS